MKGDWLMKHILGKENKLKGSVFIYCFDKAKKYYKGCHVKIAVSKEIYVQDDHMSFDLENIQEELRLASFNKYTPELFSLKEIFLGANNLMEAFKLRLTRKKKRHQYLPDLFDILYHKFKHAVDYAEKIKNETGEHIKIYNSLEEGIRKRLDEIYTGLGEKYSNIPNKIKQSLDVMDNYISLIDKWAKEEYHIKDLKLSKKMGLFPMIREKSFYFAENQKSQAINKDGKDVLFTGIEQNIVYKKKLPGSEEKVKVHLDLVEQRLNEYAFFYQDFFTEKLRERHGDFEIDEALKNIYAGL